MFNSQPPLESIKLEDIINYIDSDIIILKIDIEGYECKALKPDVLLNKQGKFIPYIFMEWRFLPTDKRNTCPHFGKCNWQIVKLDSFTFC